MKSVCFILLLLLLILQYALWSGEGGLIDVWDLNSEIATQQAENEQLRGRNRALEAEVIDLKKGLEAIEERARSDLGMVGKDETFVRVIEE